MKETFLGVDVSTHGYTELLKRLMNDIDEKRNAFIVAINPEKVMKAQQDEELKTLLNKATYQIPDGIGVVLASILKGGKIRERVTGIDMMLRLCEESAKQGKKVFLYGAKPGIADAARKKLEEIYPTIQIVGTMNGYEKDQEVIKNAINESKADIVFVALGSPTQEYWIINNMEQLHASVFQGVGGSFDVVSGRLKRAPMFFQKIGLEWFYRLVKEPWRWRRQLILPSFLWKVLRKN